MHLTCPGSRYGTGFPAWRLPGGAPMNAIELLVEQHKKVAKALETMCKADRVDPAMLRQIGDELVAHMVIEEHVFYPRIRELLEDMTAESFEEHAVARFELARAMIADGEHQKARLTVLKELIEHHVEEEEKEMFPKVRSKLSMDELDQLGTKMKAMFEKAVEMGLDQLVQGQGDLGKVGASKRTSGTRRVQGNASRRGMTASSSR